MDWSKQATILGPPGPAPSGTGLVKTAAGILVNPAALLVNADVAGAAAIAESKLALASDAAAGTASRRTLGAAATAACAGNDVRLMPTGAEMMWPVATPPAGWLIEDGSSQLIASYPALSALIRGTYNGVDGTHFYLPDMRGLVPVGFKAGDADFSGGTGGEKTHQLTAAESGLPAHAHTFRSGSGAGINFFTSAGSSWNTYTATLGFVNATSNADAAAAHNNLQPYRVRNFVIKT